MSKALLKEHLLIEFLNESDLDHGSVAADVNTIFDIWRKKSGRHYSAEQITLAFSVWWLKQFDLHLYCDGRRASYRKFVERLSEV